MFSRWTMCAGVLAGMLLALEATGGKGNGKGNGGGGGGDPEIAFLRHRTKSGGNTQFEDSLMVMDADGSNQSVIWTESDPTGLLFTSPSWSPDGTKIVFSNPDGIQSINKDGSGRVQVTNGGTGPAWSPDGAEIAYRRNDDIWLVDVDGANDRNVTNTPGVREGEPAWSADGSQLAYTTRVIGTSQWDLVVKTLATGVVASVVAGGPLAGLELSRPGWARTENRLAVSDGDLWIIDLGDPTTPDRITATVAEENAPGWSPDDAQLVFERGGAIYSIDTDGAGETLLAEGSAGRKWTFVGLRSPDWKR